eukprot:m.82401 g.82401  ORF g.82401 m.82401 type:complete len:450 (-) comp14914_c0_seq2:349-1698(-)
MSRNLVHRLQRVKRFGTLFQHVVKDSDCPKQAVGSCLRSRRLAALFDRPLPRLSPCLMNILPRNSPLCEGQIFIGFSVDGRHLLSYQCRLMGSRRYVYTLFWWRFVPGQRLVAVYCVPLFRKCNLDSTMDVRVVQTDLRTYVVVGRSAEASGGSWTCVLQHIHFHAGPYAWGITCSSCKTAMNDKKWKHVEYCVEFSSQDPCPEFSPGIDTSVDGCLFINTGRDIHFLRPKFPSPCCTNCTPSYHRLKPLLPEGAHVEAVLHVFGMSGGAAPIPRCPAEVNFTASLGSLDLQPHSQDREPVLSIQQIHLSIDSLLNACVTGLEDMAYLRDYYLQVASVQANEGHCVLWVRTLGVSNKEAGRPPHLQRVEQYDILMHLKLMTGSMKEIARMREVVAASSIKSNQLPKLMEEVLKTAKRSCTAQMLPLSDVLSGRSLEVLGHPTAPLVLRR